ncbi:MAG: lycopene cyclase [Chitinophagaceae bacterium]
MSPEKKYDYIITGAGCAGLSLVVHMIKSGQFQDEKILLIDKGAKKANDRTWCFWEKNDGLFQSIVFKQWSNLFFKSNRFANELDIAPYQYKMIRGIDFYNYCLHEISKHANIEFIHAPVQHIFSTEKSTGVLVNDEAIYCDYIFNSIVFDQPQLSKKEYWLLQHFKGWIIQTEQNCFDSTIATLMDFCIDQKEGTAFCYVLPFSANKALVEYTLFSPNLLQPEAYDAGLKKYIEHNLGINAYQILDKEFGVIPMTNFEFAQHRNNIINIGTAGGYTKGSSGYTFQFIQKASEEIVQRMMAKGYPYQTKKSGKRFHFYDSVLLNILYNRTLEGSDIFTDLFQKNKPQRILKFLDNETSLSEELSIINTLPTMPFLKAAIRQLI